MSKSVAPAQFDREFRKMLHLQFTSLSRHTVFRTVENADRHARRISPVAARAGGTARWGINPSFRRPKSSGARQPGPKADPGSARINRLRGKNKIADHGYLTFSALDKRGVFDYAGIMLEDGYSPQAPRGVLGPSLENTLRVKNRLIRKAIGDAKSELRRAGF